MPVKLLRLLAFGALLLGLPSAYAQTAILTFDSAVVETGERIKAHLLVVGIEPDTVDLQSWETFFPKENQLEKSPWSKKENGWETALQFIYFDSATLELPPLLIRLQTGDTLFSNPSQLTIIATPIPSTNLNDLSDIKDIHPEPKNWKDYQAWIWALIALLGGAVLFWIVKKQLNKPENPLFRATQLSPLELASKKLDLLEKHKPWTQGQYHLYYTALSEIVRTFLSDQYNCMAIQLGDEAVITLLPQLPITDYQRQALRSLLQLTALAKFAEAYPPDDYHPEALKAARLAIHSTDPAA